MNDLSPDRLDHRLLDEFQRDLPLVPRPFAAMADALGTTEADVLDRLEPERREAFVLTQLLGLSYAEAAEVAGCPVGTIRSRVARGRAHLMASLDRVDDDDAGGDPVLERLLPPGHASDPEIATDYRDMTEAALREGKADDLATVRASLPVGGGEVVRLDPTVRALAGRRVCRW